jgi:hypothetical protein
MPEMLGQLQAKTRVEINLTNSRHLVAEEQVIKVAEEEAKDGKEVVEVAVVAVVAVVAEDAERTQEEEPPTLDITAIRIGRTFPENSK